MPGKLVHIAVKTTQKPGVAPLKIHRHPHIKLESSFPAQHMPQCTRNSSAFCDSVTLVAWSRMPLDQAVDRAKELEARPSGQVLELSLRLRTVVRCRHDGKSQTAHRPFSQTKAAAPKNRHVLDPRCMSEITASYDAVLRDRDPRGRSQRGRERLVQGLARLDPKRQHNIPLSHQRCRIQTPARRLHRAKCR